VSAFDAFCVFVMARQKVKNTLPGLAANGFLMMHRLPRARG
jgi:hypothetical protein